MIALAKNKIKDNEATFIIIKNNEIVYEDSGIGVSCIRRVINSNPTLLQDAIIVDKIIGKAACMLLIPYNVKAIHTLLISETAIKVLDEYKVNYAYETSAEYIINRTNDGMCPLEKSVLNITDFNEAKIKIEGTISILMKAK